MSVARLASHEGGTALRTRMHVALACTMEGDAYGDSQTKPPSSGSSSHDERLHRCGTDDDESSRESEHESARSNSASDLDGSSITKAGTALEQHAPEPYLLNQAPQESWKHHQRAPAPEDQLEGAAAARIAAISWMVAAEVDADDTDTSELLRETSGLVEKLADGAISRLAVQLASWQLVLWQRRYVRAELGALCYRKVTANGQPKGRETRIQFADVCDITQFTGGEFALRCTERSYTFKLSSERRCTAFVQNLRQLHEQHLATIRRQ